MKKKIVFNLILVLSMWTTVLSQTYVIQAKPKGSKNWGYADNNGKMIIEPKFYTNYEFTKEGYALVVYKTRFAIINIKGEVIATEVNKLKPLYNYVVGQVWVDKHTLGPPGLGVFSFSDGYLVVTENKKWGCLSPDGKIAIPIKYDRLTIFNDGHALAELDNKFFVLDKGGTEISVDAQYILEIRHFSEGLGIIQVKGEKWGFVDYTGKISILPQYEGVGYFSGGLAWAKDADGKIGYINKKGEWTIKPQFDVVKAFDSESGLAMVKVDGQWGYVDTKGELCFFNETEKTYVFSNGLAIGRKDGKIGFLNNKGQWAISPQFDAALSFKNGYAAVESEKRWGIIDKEGNWIVRPTFSEIGNMTIIK